MSASNELLPKLRSQDAHLRFDALKQLTGPAPESDVRVEAVRIALDDKQGYNRVQAIKLLRPLWPASDVVRVYSARLRDELYIAQSVLEILGEIADPQAISMISACYFSAQNLWLRVSAIAAMGRAPQQAIYDFVVKTNALNHRDEKVRAAMVAMLGRQRNVTMRRLFLEKLKDPDARVRANAVEALGLIMSGIELARVVAPYAVADPNNRVRANGLVLLLQAGVAKAQDFLIQMADHADARWRASAAYALRQVPPSAAFAPWVRKLATDADETVAAQAELALPRYA